MREQQGKKGERRGREIGGRERAVKEEGRKMEGRERVREEEGLWHLFQEATSAFTLPD